MTRMLIALLFIAAVPAVLARRHGGYSDTSRPMRALLQASAAGTNQLTQDEADSLVGVWTIQNGTLHFFSPQLVFFAAGRQYSSSGSVNATQAFQAGFNTSALVASASRGVRSLANSTIEQFLGELVIVGADPATGIFAGAVVLGNASSGNIFGVSTIMGTAIKSGEVIAISGNDQSPDFTFTGIISNGTLNLQVQNLDADTGDDGDDISYIAQAAYEKSSATLNSVVNAIFKFEMDSRDNDNGDDDNDEEGGRTRK